MTTTGKKWTPEEKEQVFTQALEVLRSGYEGSMALVWRQAQMVLPAERRYDEFSNSYPTILTAKFKKWRKAQPGPHPELDKLPQTKKRQAQSLATGSLHAVPMPLAFCPQCGTDRNLCHQCGFDFRSVKFIAA